MNTKTQKEIEQILEIDKALKWNGKGYSPSYLSGYQKAYQQVKNDMPKIMKIFSSHAEHLAKQKDEEFMGMLEEPEEEYEDYLITGSNARKELRAELRNKLQGGKV